MSPALAELAALRALYDALDPALGPVVEDVDGATVLAVTAWPDHPWAAEQGATRVAVKAEPGGASHRGLLRAGFVECGVSVQWREAAARDAT